MLGVPSTGCINMRMVLRPAPWASENIFMTWAASPPEGLAAAATARSINGVFHLCGVWCAE